jgi:outer membrane lipoprotein SlyB
MQSRKLAPFSSGSSPGSSIRLCSLAPLVLLAAACAGNGPIVDTKGIDQARYKQDLNECETYAGQVNTAKAAGKSAAAGAVVGGIVGAIFGNSTTVVQSAGVGGVLGGAQGAASGEQSKDQVVKNCLRGRGYSVLN